MFPTGTQRFSKCVLLMDNKENKIAVDARWRKVSECEEKENAFQLLRSKLSWWGHCGWERELKCSKRSPLQLLQIGLVGNFKELYKVGQSCIFTYTGPWKNIFAWERRAGFNPRYFCNVFCMQLQILLQCCPASALRCVRLLLWQVFGHESSLRLQGCRPQIISQIQIQRAVNILPQPSTPWSKPIGLVIP